MSTSCLTWERCVTVNASVAVSCVEFNTLYFTGVSASKVFCMYLMYR